MSSFLHYAPLPWCDVFHHRHKSYKVKWQWTESCKLWTKTNFSFSEVDGLRHAAIATENWLVYHWESFPGFVPPQYRNSFHRRGKPKWLLELGPPLMWASEWHRTWVVCESHRAIWSAVVREAPVRECVLIWTQRKWYYAGCFTQKDWYQPSHKGQMGLIEEMGEETIASRGTWNKTAGNKSICGGWQQGGSCHRQKMLCTNRDPKLVFSHLAKLEKWDPLKWDKSQLQVVNSEIKCPWAVFLKHITD